MSSYFSLPHHCVLFPENNASVQALVTATYMETKRK